MPQPLSDIRIVFFRSSMVTTTFGATSRQYEHAVREADGCNSKHVTRIVFDAMLLEKVQKLLLESFPPMMFFLIIDVCDRFAHL